MDDLRIPGRSGGEPPKAYPLDLIDRDIIRMGLRRDIDMRRYVPEVMSLCARLEIAEPPWMDEEQVRERVQAHRKKWPRAGKPDSEVRERSGMGVSLLSSYAPDSPRVLPWASVGDRVGDLACGRARVAAGRVALGGTAPGLVGA
jgi:hypothetical protein